MDNRELLQAGIQAAKEGDFEYASVLLTRVVNNDPDSEEGWLWLGKSRKVESQRNYCFQRALQINPQNTEAKSLLGEFDQVVSTQDPASPSAPLPPNDSVQNDVGKSDSRTKVLALMSGFALAFLLCGIPFIYFVSTGRLQQFAIPFGYAAQTAVVAPVPSATVSHMPLSTPTPDISSLSYLERLDVANPYVSEALGYYYQGAYAESIRAWDKVIAIIPEDDTSYYLRGDSYLKLLNNQRSQEEYLFYLSRAGEDFNKAIELAPYENGNYYLGRFKYYDNLSATQTYRVDRISMQKIALDNLLIANQLGTHDPSAEHFVIYAQIVVGNCDAGIEQAKKLISTLPEPLANLPLGLALGYMCKNDAETALQYIDEAISIKDNCTRRFERAKIYYVLGRIEDAVADLDYSIANDPYYCGDRYYLRGLLFAEMGDLQKAEDDLYFGIGQTWGRGGLLSYAQGKIALAHGETSTAILYFQEAEATYPLEDGILEKIRADLSSLGAFPLDVTSSIQLATPISSPTPVITPRPTSSPDPSLPTPIFPIDPRLQYAWSVDLDKPVDSIFLGQGFGRLWHFQPAQSLAHTKVERLSIWFISSNTNQKLPRQLFLWNFRSNAWSSADDLHWGENIVNAPNDFVSPDGDVYIHLLNQDPEVATLVDSFGLTLVLQQTDGSIEVHGITP